MKYKTIFKINTVLGLAISLYITIQGFISHGAPVCLGLTEITRCGFGQVLMQVLVLAIIAFVALTLIFGGLKLLFKKRKSKQTKLTSSLKEKPSKEVKEEIEEPKEEIIKI